MKKLSHCLQIHAVNKPLMLEQRSTMDRIITLKHFLKYFLSEFEKRESRIINLKYFIFYFKRKLFSLLGDTTIKNWFSF